MNKPSFPNNGSTSHQAEVEQQKDAHTDRGDQSPDSSSSMKEITWSPLPLMNETEIRKTLITLVEPGNVFELRLLEATTHAAFERERTYSGYFDNADDAIDALSRIRTAKGIYITLNPVIPDLLAIRRNRLDVAKSGETTADNQILIRRWLLIDCDPKRVSSKISANDSELQAANHKAAEIEAFLTGRGFPKPIRAQSGNGAHLLYRVDLPVNDDGLIENVLAAIASRFDDERVSIDQAVFNPARITKLYGTRACKGDRLEDRPHRMSQITEIPTPLEIVSPELLQGVAATRQPTPSASSSASITHQGAKPLTMNQNPRDLLMKHGIHVKSETSTKDSIKLILDQCPFDSNHGSGTDVAVFLNKNGNTGFKCQHSSCAGKKWKDVLQHLEGNSSTTFEEATPSNTSSSALNQKPAVASAIISNQLKRLNEGGRFYHDSTSPEFKTALYFDQKTKVLENIQSDMFKARISNETGLNRATNEFRQCMAAIETEALTGSKTQGVMPEVYFARRDKAFYISNGDGHMVKIVAGNYELVDNGTDGVLFAKGSTLPPWKLVKPQDPFETCAVFRDANYSAAHGKMLFKLVFVSIPTVPKNKPVPVITGFARSGKTTMVKALQRTYGLAEDIEKPSNTDNSETAYWTSIDGGGIYCLDNADSDITWLPDAAAAASTGGCKHARKLYTDKGRVVLTPRAWTFITSANPKFATDDGLADRCLVTRMHRRTGNTSDEALMNEVEANRNASLSWVAHTLAEALADTGSVLAGLNSRHPDFAELAVRVGRALHAENEAILALRMAEQDKSCFQLENDPVGAAILDMLEAGRSFSGTAAELLKILSKYDPEFGTDTTFETGRKRWNAKSLGKKLDHLWPNLEEIAKASRHKNRTGVWEYTIQPSSYEATTSAQDSSSSPEAEKGDTEAVNSPHSDVRDAEEGKNAGFAGFKRQFPINYFRNLPNDDEKKPERTVKKNRKSALQTLHTQQPSPSPSPEASPKKEVL